jgi:hypothetical protein
MEIVVVFNDKDAVKYELIENVISGLDVIYKGKKCFIPHTSYITYTEAEENGMD